MNEKVSHVKYSEIENLSGAWSIVEHCEVSTQADIKDNEIKLIVSNAKGAHWHSELRYGPFEVEEGEVYALSFETKAKVAYRFSVWLGQFDAPYAALIADENHFGEALADGQWRSFSHEWVVTKREVRARLVFVVGPIDNIVEFRNIRLIKISR
ncbi:carbohydrate binding domain-containing protein [Kiritimatiellota bacterium B12222]|nr:carbohydrate binding domain-containing protein [Kiritimatiellota bacterium B12222]